MDGMIVKDYMIYSGVSLFSLITSVDGLLKLLLFRLKDESGSIGGHFNIVAILISLVMILVIVV